MHFPLTRHTSVCRFEVGGEVLRTRSNASQREVGDGDCTARSCWTARVGERQHVHSAANRAVVFLHAPDDSQHLQTIPSPRLRIVTGWLVAWFSRTSVSDRPTFPALKLTYSWRVITYVGKPSAIGSQPGQLSLSSFRVVICN